VSDRLQSLLVNAAFVAGLALCATAAGLVYLPAGLLVAGVELAGGAYLYEAGRMKGRL